METKNMRGYFQHIKNKTYLDKYPETIVKLEKLIDKSVVEIGCGIGNDMMLMITKGVNPENIWLIDNDYAYLVQALEKVDALFGNRFTYNHRNQYHHHGLVSIPFPDEFADFVYCNNVILCLGNLNLEEELTLFANNHTPNTKKIMEYVELKPKDRIKKLINESYRMLRDNGVLFGRTFEDIVDIKKMDALKADGGKSSFHLHNAKQIFSGELIGISPQELSQYAREAGFTETYTELRTPDWKPVNLFYFKFVK